MDHGGEAYTALEQWVSANGYRVSGPTREVNLRMTGSDQDGASQTDSGTIAEIQFPVEKV